MADEPERTVDAEMVRHLARLAGIKLDDERRELVAEQLDGLLAEANHVNEFMEGRREVGPAVRFGNGAQTRDG